MHSHESPLMMSGHFGCQKLPEIYTDALISRYSGFGCYVLIRLPFGVRGATVSLYLIANTLSRVWVQLPSCSGISRQELSNI